MNYQRLTYYLPVLVLLCSCASKPETLFTSLQSGETGINFVNRLTDTDSINIIEYLYYYNGGGVAIADFNNDGLADVYFTSNQESNKLYLNKGSFKFEDITDKAGVQGKGNWKTGVTIADVNGDGWLDIYVCEVGKYKTLHGRNELFINKGTTSPGGEITFREQAAAYGLDAEGFNTQAVFFDYDHDGDLDMFLVNHSVHSTDTYVSAAARLVKNEVSGDKLFRNDGGYFSEVTKEANIYSSIIGYGLNVSTGDLNNDGWEDIYVTNDFHENDYYYVNQQNGTFKELNAEAFGHESRFSMGSDIADLNNDGWLDIITLDMLAAEEKILKTSAGDDPLEIFNYKLGYGYHYQYSKNCLQLNTGGGKSFSDIALFAGVAATDWSWSPLAADFDNDGIKDLFITNGIVHRPNDLDYIKFSSASSFDKDLSTGKLSAAAIINKMPGGKMHNYMFRGTDGMVFEDKSMDWGFETPTWSNGAAYADLDNDGDLDIVVNNINETAGIYKNNSAVKSGNHFLDVQLKGMGANKFAIGAKVIIKQKDLLQLSSLNTTKGFESSSLQYVHFGLSNIGLIDSLQVIWPDGKLQSTANIKANQLLVIEYKPDANPPGNLLPAAGVVPSLFTDITASVNLTWKHRENDFNDFNVQALMPHSISSRGPALAVADVNNDGLDDLYVCGAKYQAGEIFLQTNNGKFTGTGSDKFGKDSLCEDVNALFFDADGDGDKDLYVVSGGNETEHDSANLDRLYINDGKGNFKRSEELPLLFGNKSVAAAADIDHDGDLDLFVGGRVAANRYGDIPRSYLLLNNGKGKFSIADERMAPGLQQAGLITDAAWTDIDKDGWQDLVLTGEWMPVAIFKNENGKLINAVVASGLSATTGWWNTLQIADINGDGFNDILAGNLGINSKFRGSQKFPLELYTGDFDSNGDLDQLMAVEKNGSYYPFASKEDLESQLPSLIKKKYLGYASFAGQTMQEVFGPKLDSSKKFTASMLSSVSLINNGHGGFVAAPLPAEAQWSPVFAFYTADFNNDGTTDILAAGNFYGVHPYEGRYDASYGTVLLNQQNKGFKAAGNLLTGLHIDREVRQLKTIKTAAGNIIAVARNNNSIQFLKFVERRGSRDTMK